DGQSSSEKLIEDRVGSSLNQALHSASIRSTRSCFRLSSSSSLFSRSWTGLPFACFSLISCRSLSISTLSSAILALFCSAYKLVRSGYPGGSLKRLTHRRRFEPFSLSARQLASQEALPGLPRPDSQRKRLLGARPKF